MNLSLTKVGDAPTLQDFGHDVWWLVLIKVLFVFVLLLLLTLFTIMYERKALAWMSQRPGPNQVGPGGWLQSLTDGLKLPFKEEIIPRVADKVVYFMAPVISAACAFVAFSVVPFGPMVSIFGHRTPLQVTDAPVAVLVVLAASSMGVYGVVLAGWASGSTYPLLGGLRSSAQMISYEVAMGLSIVAVFMTANTMSTSEIVKAQSGNAPTGVDILGWNPTLPSWYAVLLLPSFIIYAISAVGETNRAPFDLPEAESELVGGFHTEYSSFKFGMFYLGEYINMITVSAIGTTLFLGGWHAPWPLTLWSGANSGWWPMVWFLGKVLLLLFGFIWLRMTLPRLRYDQFMHFGWKVLLPANLVWILVLAGIKVTADWQQRDRLILLSGVLVAVLLVVFLWPEKRRTEQPVSVIPPGGRIGGADGFPMPPLDLQVPPSPRARRIPAERQPVGADATPGGATTSQATLNGTLADEKEG